MSLDTVAKRLSVIALGSPWRALLPLPDGALDAGDRAQLLGLAAAPFEVVSSPIVAGVRPAIAIDPDGYWFADVLLLSPSSDVVLTFDWSGVVDDTRALSGVTHTAPGLTIVSEDFDADSARSQARVKDAQHGRLYSLSLRATLSNGEVFERQYPVRGWAS